MERIRVTGTGGVNLFADPADIRDDQLAYAKNVIPVKPGRLGKRPGLGFHSKLLVHGRITAAVVPPFPSADLVHTARLENSEDDQLNVVQYGDSSYVPSATLDDEVLGLHPWLLSVDRRVLVFPSETTGKVWQVAEVDGAPVISRFEFAGTGNEALQPRFACMYRNRLVYMNFGPGLESTLLFSDPDSPETVGDDALTSRGISLAADGGEIVGAVEVMLTSVGSPVKSALLVLCRYRAFILTGEAGLTTDTDPLQVAGDLEANKTSYACGCASPRTIVQTRYGIVWADTEDVWLFAPGQVPVSIGMNIQPVLKNTPEDYLYKWHAAYFNGFYRLALMSDGQGPSESSGCGEQWWLDLRSRPPRNSDEARWWGPQVFNVVTSPNSETPTSETNFMFVDARVGKPPALYGLEMALADIAPYTPVWAVVAYDTPEFGRDLTVDTTDYTIDAVYGSECSIEIHTKEYQVDDALGVFIYEGCELSGTVSRETELGVVGLVDGRLVADASSYLSAEGFTLDVNATDGADITDQLTNYTSQVLVPANPEDRPNGSRVQLRIQDWPSFAVGGETFSWTYAGASYEATFPDDTAYSNLNTFATGVVALMNAAVGANVFFHDVSIAPPRAAPVVTITADAAWLWGYNQGFNSRVWALLGYKPYYTGAEAGPDPSALAQPADDRVFWKPSNNVELRGIRVIITPYNRRPEP